MLVAIAIFHFTFPGFIIEPPLHPAHAVLERGCPSTACQGPVRPR